MTETPPLLGGRYELGRVLGRGGMAEVHLGRDLRLSRAVAIKLLRADLARDPSFLTRFRREAQSAASLNNPAIVAVYDTGEDVLGGYSIPYIVMEYVPGRTLRELLSSGSKLLPERALEITAGVLAALDYSHRHGIIHRDIKPGNVMLSESGDVKVMDFGIARAVADTASTMTQTASVLGTAQYLSPEQARGETVDARSDIYSTGCLLYELLTGRPPFVGDSPVAVAYQHVREQPRPPSALEPEVPPVADAITMKALQKDPGDRYASAGEMRADIERAFGGRPLVAPAYLPPRPAERTAVVPTPPAAAATRTTVLAPGDRDARGVGRDREAGDVRDVRGFRDDRHDRRRRRGGWLLLAILALAVAVGMFLLGGALRGQRAERVSVPRLINATQETAEKRLRDAGLRGDFRTVRSDERRGTVVGQDPDADMSVAKGSTVRVNVSAGRDRATVPRVSGLSLDAARTVLTDAGFTLGDVIEDISVERAGTVLGSSPAQGTAVNAGSRISLQVANGQNAVPEARRRSVEAARAELRAAGFEVDETVRAGSGSAGTVLDQAPSAGTVQRLGSTVTLIVSSGRTAAPAPSVPPSPRATPTASIPSAPRPTPAPPSATATETEMQPGPTQTP